VTFVLPFVPVVFIYFYFLDNIFTGEILIIIRGKPICHKKEEYQRSNLNQPEKNQTTIIMMEHNHKSLNPLPILRTENLSRIVPGKTLVDHISIQVQPGAILAIIGPSGSGKSSFLRLINRLDEPTQGTVFLEGQDYRHIPPCELRRRVGMVMQAPNLFPGSVADNLRYGPAQRGEELSDQQIDSLLAQVGLLGYAAQSVSVLSGGEAQRVSLARTLANTPEVLLLDEPTSALDEAAEAEVEATLKNIFTSQGLTCLFVTHDMAQAARLASHAMLMETGRLVKYGSLQEVFDA